ncbi:DUF3243 domain-containing protein [Exiguobacterium flavidum]|uniref:DUF3243 domain-containing protein n=1 Tax=Exiguobacterium flavidum TaxID=2184695 RepID=UPI000DF7A978|nr:DUF3243 domain-containing protein [Exiguobacterium flavidum]
MEESQVSGKVEQKLSQMDEESKEQILSNFEQFKSYLGDKVSKGESLGLNDNQLAKVAEKVADYLAKHEEPRNREEYLLQELWKAGDESERKSLASLLVKLVK